MNATEASAAAHASSGTWSTTKAYGPGWELDSPNGAYRAVFQTDHNFVVYHGGKPIWASGTDKVTLVKLVFTASDFVGSKGNIEVGVYCTVACSYPASTKQWSNRVNFSTSVYRIVMQNDGNFVEYTGTSGGKVLWATGTEGK